MEGGSWPRSLGAGGRDRAGPGPGRGGGAGGGRLRGQHRAPARPGPGPPASRARRDAPALRRRHLGRRLPGDGDRERSGPGPVHAPGRLPAPAGPGRGARPLPGREPAQHPALRRLSRPGVQALGGPRPGRRLPRAVRVGRPRAGRALRPLPVVAAEAGLRARRPEMTADVLVVGAGPTGLTLALQAHDHGARVRVLDRRPEPFRPSRAMIVHPRTLEVLHPLGVTEALLARAEPAPRVRLRLGPRVVRLRLGQLDLADVRFPHLSFLRQTDLETVLAGALRDRGVEVEWGTELVDLEEAAAGVRARVRSRAGLEEVGCGFVAGCDGPTSRVRACAGIGWRGGPYSEEIVLADAELAGLEPGITHAVVGRRGLLLAFPQGERATWRLLLTRAAGPDRLPFGQPGPSVPTADLQERLDEAGLEARIVELRWSGRVRLQHRLATCFGRGRLYLAGDAAHSYSPATGQGMNTGIQDAANLGWKLAFAASGTASAALLGSYDLERRPVARRVLALTHVAFWGEASTHPLPSLLRGVLAPLGAPAIPALLSRPRLVAAGVRVLSQLWVAYPGSQLSVEGRPGLGAGPRAGQRLPDAVVTGDGRRVRLHDLLAGPGVHVLLQRDAAPIRAEVLGPRVVVHRLSSAPE